MLPALRECFEQVLRAGRYRADTRVIELADPDTGRYLSDTRPGDSWGRIILRSAVAKGGLESATARAAWLDECGQDEFTLETWEAVLRRLSLAQGRVLGTTTPYNLGWVKTAVYDRWLAGDPDFEVVQFRSTQNPAFPREEFERARATMPAWRFRMFYEGQFARPAGLIYDCFDEAIHVVEPFDIPREWPRYAGLDFGAVNTALVWLAENPDTNALYAYRESLEGGLSTREHVARAKAAARHETLVAVWGGAGSEDQQRADWGAEGLAVQRPPVADVEAGIARVYGLLKRKRLFVFRTCRGLLDELGSYRRKLDPQGQPLEEIVDKRAFHRLDALRYVASGLTGGRASVTEDFWR